MSNITTIKLFEDTKVQLVLTEKEKKDILKIQDIIGENNVNMQADGKLTISHYVGFVQINTTRVLIYPKIARYGSKDSFDQAFKILLKMMSYTEFYSVKKVITPQHMGKYDGDLLELFMGIFIEELLILFKRDINRSYSRYTENQSFIKGKIDFAETIKNNSFRKHLHYVKYDSFTEDILLNQIFKTVVNHLLKRSKLRDNKIRLKQAHLWLEDVNMIKITNDIWERVTFSRHNAKYEPLFNMAKLFYYNSQPNLNKGDELTFSFLVPLNQLFERYVYEMVKKNLDSGFLPKYQQPVKYLGKINQQKCLQLKPDISIQKGDKTIFILDAKYKQILDSEGKVSVNQGDIYQMLAYSVRYHCNDVILVYPKFTNYDEDLPISSVDIKIYNEVLKIHFIILDLEKDADLMALELNDFLMNSGTFMNWQPDLELNA